MKALLEASKSELVKWVLATATTLIGLTVTAGVALVRIMHTS